MADSGTIAAWAALAAALLALVVALAQAAQQYAATAQDMKKCERSVWGPMPGYAGRRVFIWRQLRFRIVFDVPNIFIPTDYWERRGNARQFPTHRITTLPAPFDPPSVNTDTESAIYNHSEACWVAFARQVSHVCPSAVRVGLMAGDADRLPADIPVVPMQVSLRDIVALGLMIGMNIQEVDEDYIEMSGPFGFIKSSSHPILGRLIHFSAFSTTPHIKGLKAGDISKSWLRRLIGIASVAKQQFDEPKRRSYASTMMRWRTNSTRIPSKIENLDSDKRGRGKEVGESQLKFVDLKGKEHTVPADKCSTWQDLLQFLENNGIATAPYIILGPENKAVAPKSWKPLLKVVRKGHLKTIFKIAEGDYPPSPPATMSHSKSSSPEPNIKETTDQQIPPDINNVTKHAIRTLEGSASLTEAILAESAESITHAESLESIILAESAESITHADLPEPNRDISLDLFLQGNTTQNTMERDRYFPIRGSINPTNQIAPMQTKDSWNGKERPVLTWVEDGVRGESLTDGSRTKVSEGPSLVRIPYRRPTVEDYSHDDSSSSSLRSSSRSRRENRNGDSRSPSIRHPPAPPWPPRESRNRYSRSLSIRRRYSPPRFSRENRYSRSPSIRRRRYSPPLFPSEIRYPRPPSIRRRRYSPPLFRGESRNSDSGSPSIRRRRYSPPLFRRESRSSGSRSSDSRSPSIYRRRFSPPRLRRRNRSSDSRSPSIYRRRFPLPRFRRENRSNGSRSPSIYRRRFSLPRFRRENRSSDSRSPSPRHRFSPRFRRENRNDGSRSPSPRSRFYARFIEETRFRRENRDDDSRSPSLRRENSFDSERNWRDKQTRAYASIETPRYHPDPPQLTFYWASQIDIELGCWATPWQRGMDALDMMVDIGLAGLSQTARLAQPKANRPAVDSNEIIYAEFPGPVILGDLWIHLREGEHTWPPYAINARGGVRGLATHSLVQHSAFRDDERLPQLTLLNSVHKAGMSTAETSTASQVLERDRILELASIDFWLSHAAATNSISKGKSNLVINTPAIVEEIWLKFSQEIMDTRKELWNPGGGDMPVRKLANYISDFLSDFLGSPAEIYFVWVAFLRAVKVMECVANGPQTFPALHIFENDILVYLV